MSEHPKHMSLRSRMDSGSFVQHAVDRRAAQSRCRDDLIYGNGSPNIHISTGEIFAVACLGGGEAI
jgi:hypothetical protein